MPIPRKIHATVTLARVMEACRRHDQTLDNPGFCLACGSEADECEPDAREYTCEYCSEPQVYGASEVLVTGAYHADKTGEDDV
jgi:hypothetical protein